MPDEHRRKAEERMALLFRDTPERDQVIADVLAAGVRNGLEDLHVAGVFDDDQVPALNNGVRARLLDALAKARRIAEGERDPELLAWGLRHLDEDDDVLTAATPNACILALEAFALSIGITPPDSGEIVEAGLDGLVTTIDLLHRLLDPADADARDLVWWIVWVYVPKVTGERAAADR